MYIYIHMRKHLDNSSQITNWLNLKLLVIIFAIYIYIITKLENDCGGWVPSALKFKYLAVSV